MSLDDLNDTWGNMGRSLNRFSRLHPEERILYSSSGALFKRRGDTPFKRWTMFLNRRGNLIISGKRCFFSNPAISGEIIALISVPFMLGMVIIFALLAYFIGLIITGNIFLAGLCDLCISPFLLLILAIAGINVSQRLPCEIDLPLSEMRRTYMGRYRSLTRECPLFSCYDGKQTYHFLGYRLMDPEQTRIVDNMFQGS